MSSVETDQEVRPTQNNGPRVALSVPMFVRAFYWCVQFLASLGIWLLFVDQLRLSETLAGLGAAALAATAAEAVRGHERPRFDPELRNLLDFRRVPAQILRDTWLVSRNLALLIFRRGVSGGTFHSIPFEAGGDDGRSAARRALAILYSTLPPNTIVIGIDRPRNQMLLHTLEGRP